MSTFVLVMSEEILQALRDKVENMLGQHLSVRSDFDFLVSKIEECSNERLSSTTLRRFWGYQQDQSANISQHSLDVLSRYCGYSSFEAFHTYHNNNDEAYGDQSYFTHSRQILLDDIMPGQRIRLTWNPGRCLIIRFNGGNSFSIIENINSKLEVGMTFDCATFIQGEPLFFTNIKLNGNYIGNYVCGRNDGVTFKVLK